MMKNNFERTYKVLIKCYNKSKEDVAKYLETLPDMVKTLHRPMQDAVVKEDELSRISQIVFSPDPLTGNPTCDIAYLLSSGDDGFKEYVKNMLFKDNPNGVIADDPEESAALVRKNMMTYGEYEEMLRNYVISQNDNGNS